MTRRSAVWCPVLCSAALSAVLLAVTPVRGATAGAAARSDAQEVIDGLVGSVNGKTITLSEVRLVRALYLCDGVPSTASDGAVVQKIVERRLILSEVDRYAPPEPSDAMIAERRRVWQASLPAGFDLAAAIAVEAWSEKDLHNWQRDDVRIAQYEERFFGAAAQPTSAEIAAYATAHAAEFTRAGVVPPLEAIEGEIRTRLAADNREKSFRKWLDGLRQRAEILIK
jgi:hypothetical protein